LQPEVLTMAVLYGTGNLRPDIREILESLPHLKVVGQATDIENFLGQPQTPPPDMVLVDLDGGVSLPPWFEDLTQDLTQTPVLVCSHNREPDFLIRAMQLGVREFLPLPLKKADVEAAIERVWIAKRRLRSASSRQGRLLVITGHKGGVGTTSMAVNLAIALADSALDSVALVDLGRPFPDVGNFLDQSPSHTIFDLFQNLSNLDQAFLQRIMQPYEGRLAILHGCSDIKEQDFLDSESMAKVFAQLKGLYKWIIVDLSHWLDGFFMQVIREADQVLLLTELSIPDLKNLKKLWPVLQEVAPGREKLKVVINRHQKGTDLQLSDLEQVIQRPVFDLLPWDFPSLSEAITKGVPLATIAPRSKICRSLYRLAQRLKEDSREVAEEATVSPAPRRLLRLFSKG
jgi:pilus assembly protein CpaE